MVFYETNYVFLIEIEVKPTHTLEDFICGMLATFGHCVTPTSLDK
jgi:hypothetical protein